MPSSARQDPRERLTHRPTKKVQEVARQDIDDSAFGNKGGVARGIFPLRLCLPSGKRGKGRFLLHSDDVRIARAFGRRSCDAQSGEVTTRCAIEHGIHCIG
jgi:hypothetical protein